MQIMRCPRCGNFEEVVARPRLWVMEKVNDTVLHNLKLCAKCEEDLVEFMNMGESDGTEN